MLEKIVDLWKSREGWSTGAKFVAYGKFLLFILAIVFAWSYIAVSETLAVSLQTSASQVPVPSWTTSVVFAVLGYPFDAAGLQANLLSAQTVLSAGFTIIVLAYTGTDLMYGALGSQKITGVKVRRADNGGDLRVMKKYYKNARQITVFSGSFDWIIENDEMMALIEDKARTGSIKFISSKPEAVVSRALGRLYDPLAKDFRFTQDKALDIRCSYIEYSGGKAFLYRCKDDGESEKAWVLIFEDKGNMNHLIEIVGRFISQFVGVLFRPAQS